MTIPKTGQKCQRKLLTLQALFFVPNSYPFFTRDLKTVLKKDKNFAIEKATDMTEEIIDQATEVETNTSVNLDKFTDEELLDYARGTCKGPGAQAEALVRNHRCETGRVLTELFRRHELKQERGEESQSWEDICTAIPISRKHALNLRTGYAAVLVADAVLRAAADERKIDLFQPQVNKRLRAITIKQAGQPVLALCFVCAKTAPTVNAPKSRTCLTFAVRPRVCLEQWRNLYAALLRSPTST